MIVKLNLDSKEIDVDGMSTLKVFLGDISLTDLLKINEMIIEEMNERILKKIEDMSNLWRK